MESLHEGHYHDDVVASEGRQAADGAVDVGDVLQHGVGEDDGEAAVEMGGIGWVRSSGSESGASASPLRGEGKLLVEDVSPHLGADPRDSLVAPCPRRRDPREAPAEPYGDAVERIGQALSHGSAA